MVTQGLFDKILQRVGATPEIRAAKSKAAMSQLNQRLSSQMEAQKMTPEVLAKRCTL